MIYDLFSDLGILIQ